MSFHLHLPERASGVATPGGPVRRRSSVNWPFWRGVIVGFVSAFPIFDLAINGGAMTRAFYRALGAAAAVVAHFL